MAISIVSTDTKLHHVNILLSMSMSNNSLPHNFSKFSKMANLHFGLINGWPSNGLINGWPSPWFHQWLTFTLDSSMADLHPGLITGWPSHGLINGWTTLWSYQWLTFTMISSMVDLHPGLINGWPSPWSHQWLTLTFVTSKADLHLGVINDWPSPCFPYDVHCHCFVFRTMNIEIRSAMVLLPAVFRKLTNKWQIFNDWNNLVSLEQWVSEKVLSPITTHSKHCANTSCCPT